MIKKERMTKMKSMKKIVALGLAVMLAVPFMGCGKTQGGSGDKVNATNGGKPVEIAYLNVGLGSEFMDNIVEAFNAEQSEWYAYYTASANAENLRQSYGLEDVDQTDLYMLTKVYDPTYAEPLDDLLESQAYGDTKPLKDKFDAAYLASEKYHDGHYYTLTYGGGALGMVYNKDLFKKAGIDVTPRTTNELALVCDTLKEAGITPSIHFKNDDGVGYYSFMAELMASQYDGMDYYQNTFYGNPTLETLTKKDGRYAAIKAFEKFLTPDYVVNGSNATDSTIQQTKFINEEIGMMYNGTWMANEMKGVGVPDKFGVMKSPVVSGIVDKLTTVKSDTELRNLISAIDEVTDGTADISTYQSGDGYNVNGKEVSAADWDHVKAARNSVATNHQQHSVVIPKYSDAKEGAKEFLKFFYSDKGYKIFTDTLHMTMPLSFCDGAVDTTDWTAFEQDMEKIFANSQYKVNRNSMTKHDLFVNGGGHAYASVNFYVYFCSNNPNDRISADEAWDSIIARIEGSYDNWMANIK